jgi:hypothetical protein
MIRVTSPTDWNSAKIAILSAATHLSFSGDSRVGFKIRESQLIKLAFRKPRAAHSIKFSQHN